MKKKTRADRDSVNHVGGLIIVVITCLSKDAGILWGPSQVIKILPSSHLNQLRLR